MTLYRIKSALAPTLLVFAGSVSVALPAFAQNRDRKHLVLREANASTGYGYVQLPPITLGGYLPQDVLNADLISTLGIDVGLSRVTRRSSLVFDLSGNYTGRVKYSQMSALGGTLSLGAARSVGKFRLSVGGNTSVASSDQITFQPSQTQQILSETESFKDLSSRVALVKSPNPDPVKAAWFVPINQSPLASQAYGNRLFANGVTGEVSYSPTARWSSFFGSSYSSVQRIGSSHEPGVALPFPDSKARVVTAGVTYLTTRRSQLSGTFLSSRSWGVYNNEASSALVGYGWTGRVWFMNASIGAGFRPDVAPPPEALVPEIVPPDGSEPPTTPENDPKTQLQANRVGLTYMLTVGFKTRSQTFLVGHARMQADNQGYGSLQGDGTTVLAGWYWSPVRSEWMARANFRLDRGPGNFLYINTWDASAGVGRQVQRNTRIMGEYLYNRHGSKGFEGFHLTRQAIRLNLVWTPQKGLF